MNWCIKCLLCYKIWGFNHNCRQEDFQKSAAGRAARAQHQAEAKKAANPNRGEPVLKVVMIRKAFAKIVLM